MRGKRLPPQESVAVRLRTVLRGRLPTGRALNCGRCQQRLPTLSYLPSHNEFARALRRNNGGLSPNDLYIDTLEMAEGWWIDGDTLRSNKTRLERRHYAEEKVCTMPRKETDVARQKLSSGKGLIPHDQQQREAGAPFPHVKHLPAPRYITCDRCGATNEIAPGLTPQSDAG